MLGDGMIVARFVVSMSANNGSLKGIFLAFKSCYFNVFIGKELIGEVDH